MTKFGILISIVMIMLSLSACSYNEESTVKILVPEGLTSLAQIYIEFEHPNLSDSDYTIHRVAGPDLLVAAFMSQSYDVIHAPITMGANLVSLEAPYQCAAVTTWDNLHLASSADIQNLQSLDGKTVVAFGNMSTPSIILDIVISNTTYSVNPNIEYVSSAQEAMMELLRNPSKVVLMAEPFLSNSKLLNQDIQSLAIGGIWDALFDTRIPQACVFVHTDLSDQFVENYLFHLSESIERVLESPTDAAVIAKTLNYPLDEEVIIHAVPNGGLKFSYADDALHSMTSFLEQVYHYHGALIGNKLPTLDFFRFRNED